MLAVYLSGTGNTKHCIEKLTKLLDENARTMPIESENVVEEIQKEDTIILGYPTQFSCCPYMIKDFIHTNKDIWKGKKILCVTTMGAFSGDGAGCSARILKKYGATILGGLQIHMPDAVCDSKMLKKPLEENKKIVAEADKKIEQQAQSIKNGKYPKEGVRPYHRIIGLLGQRLWFYGKTKTYSNKLKISDACIGCGLCAKQCPMKNIKMENGKAKAGNRCTMCYRCITNCPKKAITLIGKEVVEQCKFENYK